MIGIYGLTQVEIVTNVFIRRRCSSRREEVAHLSGGLFGFVKDSFGIACTFSALASEASAFFQLTHAGCTLLGSSNDVAVSYSFADTYVHLSSPEGR